MTTAENVPGKPRKTQTPAQAAAGKRNFALFQLKGMLGHLGSLHGHVQPEKILAIQEAVQSALAELTKQPPAEAYTHPSMPYLDDWTIASELAQGGRLFLRGVIFGSKKIEDNTPVRTSGIIGADRAAGTVRTATGSTYFLRGNPTAFNILCLRFGV